MRQSDKDEIFGLTWHDNPLLLAREVVQAASHGHAAISEINGVPVAIIGCAPIRPGVWSFYSFGTSEWSRSVLELTRYGRKVISQFVRERNAHRAQCESRFDHIEAHRWLKLMGAQCDGPLPGYGKDGADYLMFSWSK
jgi:hypothetical protein